MRKLPSWHWRRMKLATTSKLGPAHIPLSFLLNKIFNLEGERQLNCNLGHGWKPTAAGDCRRGKQTSKTGGGNGTPTRDNTYAGEEEGTFLNVRSLRVLRRTSENSRIISLSPERGQIPQIFCTHNIGIQLG